MQNMSWRESFVNAEKTQNGNIYRYAACLVKYSNRKEAAGLIICVMACGAVLKYLSQMFQMLATHIY